jgi:hypothetical protein
MTRRVGVALLFVLLGFASLLLVDFLLTWLCSHVSGLCKRYTGPCPGIDTCTPDTLKSIGIFAVYLGPPVIFSVSGFLFSRRPRSTLAWVALLACLFAAHTMAMIVVEQATIQ